MRLNYGALTRESGFFAEMRLNYGALTRESGFFADLLRITQRSQDNKKHDGRPIRKIR